MHMPSLAQYEIILHSLPDPVFVMTRTGRYVGYFGGRDTSVYTDGSALVSTGEGFLPASRRRLSAAEHRPCLEGWPAARRRISLVGKETRRSGVRKGADQCPMV